MKKSEQLTFALRSIQRDPRVLDMSFMGHKTHDEKEEKGGGKKGREITGEERLH